MTLKEYIDGISGADQQAIAAAKKRNDGLLKPLGSLGRLEDMAVKMAGITGKVINTAEKRCMIVMSADNGVVEEGVAGTPQEMTRNHTVNIAEGVSGVGVLAHYAGSDLKVVDIGIKGECPSELVYKRKIKNGTDNFAKGPAMTREEAEKGILTGIEMVRMCKEEGYELIGNGEMGIGNTSSTSACCMAFTGLSADEVVGKGGGLTDEGLAHKKEVITKALELNQPNPDDPIDVLCKVGGLDIAGLAGCYIGAAYYRLPIVIDGVISSVAALIANRLNPSCRDFMFASHASAEPAYKFIMKELGLDPILDMQMRLGEGTGCPLAFHIVGSACAMMRDMHTFAEESMDETYRIDIREDEK
ncbi:MAG: nicotinate-nucleotide--dimethylbenzimidazole phosphoribosyltransferase [Clostridia bacterium]|nr:nicotinate-nucleotide--dimethylbenzimidazole phosphoribosyltransferase [Clostridia bacterium]